MNRKAKYKSPARLIFALVFCASLTYLPVRADSSSTGLKVDVVEPKIVGADLRPPFAGSTERMPYVGGGRVVYVVQVGIDADKVRTAKLDSIGSANMALSNGRCIEAEAKETKGGIVTDSNWASCENASVAMPKFFKCQGTQIEGFALKAWADYVDYGAWVDEKTETSKIFRCDDHGQVEEVMTLPFPVSSMIGLGGLDGSGDAVTVYGLLKQKPTFIQFDIRRSYKVSG